MEMEVLRKKISTFRSPSGRVRNVSDDLLYEILSSWETWSGPAKGFYTALGVSSKGMASIIGKAKKMKREGVFPAEEFKEIKVNSSPPSSGSTCKDPIVLKWEKNRVIRFSQVDQLVDFLKKVA